jgi:hypothetical protein
MMPNMQQGRIDPPAIPVGICLLGVIRDWAIRKTKGRQRGGLLGELLDLSRP